jgi:hypothetical protein
MTANTHRSRKAAATAETRGTLVDLLVAHVDRAYVTAGQPGALSAVREMFGQMEPEPLTALVHQLGLAAEPVAEDEPGSRDR